MLTLSKNITLVRIIWTEGPLCHPTPKCKLVQMCEKKWLLFYRRPKEHILQKSFLPFFFFDLLFLIQISNYKRERERKGNNRKKILFFPEQYVTWAVWECLLGTTKHQTWEKKLSFKPVSMHWHWKVDVQVSLVVRGRYIP